MDLDINSLIMYNLITFFVVIVKIFAKKLNIVYVCGVKKYTTSNV